MNVQDETRHELSASPEVGTVIDGAVFTQEKSLPQFWSQKKRSKSDNSGNIKNPSNPQIPYNSVSNVYHLTAAHVDNTFDNHV